MTNDLILERLERLEQKIDRGPAPPRTCYYPLSGPMRT